MNRTVMIHPEVWQDLRICYQKNWYPTLGQELPRVCKLLIQDGVLPGSRLLHYLNSSALQNKTFRAGINLPEENVGKRRGARIVYIKEGFESIKIVYVGGHKDKRYDKSHFIVKLVCSRYQTSSNDYRIYTNGLDFNVI